MGIGATVFRLHRAVISSERHGVLISGARAALVVPSAAYGLGVTARNSLYSLGWKRARRSPVPVISVGNISAGGTGKTPFVAWLARLLAIRKMRPVILSRGYGRHKKLGVDDENLMLLDLARGVPVVVDADRLRGAEKAVAEHDANVLILDDGFQHRRIARDLDIVLIDALWPFGAGHLLPRGLLREPLDEIRRADFLLLTRTNLVSREQIEATVRRLSGLAPRVATACCADNLRSLRPLGKDGAEPLTPDCLKRGLWAAFCGIGNPEGFLLSLKKAGCDMAFLRVFSDHEQYSARQVNRLLADARAASVDRVVTTEKDAVKVERLLPEPPSPPIYALQMDLDFITGSAALIAAILKAVGQPA